MNFAERITARLVKPHQTSSLAALHSFRPDDSDRKCSGVHRNFGNVNRAKLSAHLRGVSASLTKRHLAFLEKENALRREPPREPRA